MADDLSTLSSLTRGSSSVSQLESVNSLAENFDNFLTILTTQLQNQDPLSPLDTHEFTNQLVMFADVEQSVRQSGLMEDQIALQTQNQATAAVSYLSQQIEADHNEVNYTGGSVTLGYTLPETAASANMEIYDSEGELVRIIVGIEKDFGSHSVEWDGKNQAGADLPEGSYSFQVGAVNENDQAIDATYTTQGTVTGVEFNGNSTTLMMGNVAIPLNKVLRVEPAPAA